jgi:hypothetical protein
MNPTKLVGIRKEIYHYVRSVFITSKGFISINR